jgi:phage terminase large subunit GpA-like protein
MEENIRLPAGDAAVPGKIRLYGYQRGIADAIGDPLLERVTVIKSARIGYTTLLVGALANYVHNDPSSLLCLLPVKDDARNFVVSQVEPVFAESPVVRAKLDAPKSHAHDRDTMLFRRFTGGSLRVVSAEAQRNLRSLYAKGLRHLACALPQAKLSRNSKPIARGGIRQFESYMPSQAVWSDHRG